MTKNSFFSLVPVKSFFFTFKFWRDDEGKSHFENGLKYHAIWSVFSQIALSSSLSARLSSITRALYITKRILCNDINDLGSSFVWEVSGTKSYHLMASKGELISSPTQSLQYLPKEKPFDWTTSISTDGPLKRFLSGIFSSHKVNPYNLSITYY